MPLGFSGRAGFPTEARSLFCLGDGATINSVYVTVNFSGGTLRFFVSADNGVNWEEINDIVSSQKTLHTFSNTGTQLKWRCVLSAGCSVSSIYIEKND